METKTTKNTQGLIFLILLSLFIWLFFFACDGEENSSEPTKKEPFTEINALVMSRDFVLKNLVSPSSAEFSTDESGVRKRSDNVFWVESYIDSQNGFGAMIRSKYQCLITYDPNTDMVNCSELTIQ